MLKIVCHGAWEANYFWWISEIPMCACMLAFELILSTTHNFFFFFVENGEKRECKTVASVEMAFKTPFAPIFLSGQYFKQGTNVGGRDFNLENVDVLHTNTYHMQQRGLWYIKMQIMLLFACPNTSHILPHHQ